MGVLEKIEALIAGLPDVPGAIMHNTMDSEPDNMVGLFEYPGAGPQQTFGDAEGHGEPIETVMVQVRVRRIAAQDAAENISAIDKALAADGAIRRTSSIFPIGRDDHNPPRWEFTANYEVAIS